MKKYFFLLLVLWTLTEAAIEDLPPLKCIVQNPTQPPFKPDFPLPMCSFLDELTCCSYRDAVQVQRTFNSSFQPNLSSSPLCRNNLETLWCGASCAPSQPFHVNLYEYTFVICSSFCRRIFESCSTPALVNQYASSSDPALSFCQQQLIYNFSVIVNDGVECYNGLTVDTSSSQSVAFGRGLVPGVAGLPYNFTVKAYDEFTNSRTQGNEYFEAFFTPSISNNVEDNNDGTYLVSFTPQPNLYNISVVVNGEPIYKSPFAVYFENETTCVNRNGAPPNNPAQTPAGQCQPYYSETSCCTNSDANQINSTITNVNQIYGDSAGCSNLLNNVVCALSCDPRQSQYITPENPTPTNTTTPSPGFTIYNVSICREYCSQLFDTCGSVRLAGGFTVRDYYQTGDLFCASALPQLFPRYVFTVTPSVCYGGNDAYRTSPPDSYPYGRDLHNTTACQASYFNIHTRDKYRNDRTSGGDDWHVVFNGPSTQLSDTAVGQVYDSQNGDYTVFYNLTKAGIYSVSASLNLQDFLSQSPWKLVVYPGKMDPNNTVATGPGVTSAPVGKQTSFVINSRDACGNDLITGGNTFNVTIIFPNGTVIHPTPIDNKDGTYLVPWLPPITGTYTVIITNSSGYPIKDSPYTVVVFGDLDVCRTRIVGVNQTIAGTLTTFRIITYDVTGNRYGLGGLSWVAAVSGDFISEKGRFFNANDTVRVTDNGDGTYNVTYIPFVAKPEQVYIALRTPVNRTCTVGTNATVYVLPGPLDPATTEAIGDATSVGYLNVDNVFLIQGRDSWDNSLKTGGDNFTIRFTGPGRVTFRIIDNLNGTYTVVYVPDTPGVYVMTIITKGSQIVGSPFIINVGAAPGGVYSTADGPGLETGVAGKTNIFLITAFDESGTRVYTGGDNYDVLISMERATTRSLRADTTTGASQAITLYSLPFTNGFRFVSPYDRSVHIRKTDNTDGTYTVQYITNVAGYYNVTIGSLAPRSTGPIIGSPWRVKIYPDVIYPDNSPVTGPGTVGGTVGQIIPFYIQGKDKYNNTLESGGDVIQVTFFTLGGTNVTANFTVEVIDNRNGTYSVNYATTLAGRFIMNVNLYSPNPLECRRFKDSPFLITIKPLGADCPSSIANGPGLSVAIADLSSSTSNYFYIQARDYFGNFVPAAGLTFDLAFEQNGVFFPSDAFSYTRRDFGNGTYLINYFVIGDGFVYMHVFCPGGVEIYQSPFLIEIIGQPCTPPDCNGNGACIGGQCQCLPPFLPPDCKNTGPVATADCRFSDLGVHILCDFPQETDRAGLKRYFDCDDFFNLDNTTSDFFADGNFCYWRSYSRIAIALGNNPKVKVNDTLIIRPGLFKPRFADYDSKPNVEIRARIQRPIHDPIPNPEIISWTRGPNNIPLVLDATGSTGTAGRDFVSGYNWTLVSAPANANRAGITNLLKTPPGNDTGIVTFPAGFLVPGTYTFRLDVTNYFNQSASTTVSVTVYNMTLPDVFINGPKNITARVFNDLFFTGFASAPGDLSYSWSRVEGPLLPGNLKTNGKLKNFFIPAYTLIPGQTYVFKFSASLNGNSSATTGNFTNSDTVTVHVLDPLEPTINPGERTVFRLFPLTLNATDTIAYNTNPNSYVFSWTCYNSETPGESCVTESARMLYFQSNPVVTLPGASLHPGLYVFTVNVQRDGLSAQASTQINITMENTTVVSFSRQGLSANLPKHNFEDLLRLDVSIFGIGNTTTSYKWEVSPPDFDLTDPVTLGPTDQPFLVIDSYWPVGNVLYNFTIYNATYGDPIGTIGVLVNEPPLGGICTLSDYSGTTDTLFTVRCKEWEDDDLPIYYYLIYIDPNGVENPLVENPSSSNVLQFKLPPSVPQDTPTEVKVLVRDGLGSSTNVTFYILVSSPPVQKRQISPTVDRLLASVYNASVQGYIEAETQALFNLFTYINFIANDTLTTEQKRTIRSTAMAIIDNDYKRVPNSEQGIELKLKLILALTQQPNEVNETAVASIDSFVTSVLENTTSAGMTANLARYTLQTLGRMIAANQFIDPTVASIYSRSTVENLNLLAMSVVALDIAGEPPFASQADICFTVSLPYFQNSSIYLVTVNATRDVNFARNISDSSNSSSNATKVQYCTSIFLQAKKDSTFEISRVFTHNSTGTSIVIPSSVTDDTLQEQLNGADFVVSSFWVSTTDPYAYQINNNRIDAYINSPVASLTYFANGKKLTVMNAQDPVAVTLNNYNPLTYPEYLRCRFWNDTDWSDNECVVNDATATQTVCFCNHLTEFSVLMRPFISVPSGGFGYQSAISPLDMYDDGDHIDQWWLFALVLGLGILTLLFALWHRNKRAGYVNIDDYAKRATMVITLNEEDTREPIAMNDEAALGLGVPPMRKRAKFAISRAGGEFESDVEDTPRTMSQISSKSGEESIRSESVEKRTESHATSEGSGDDGTGEADGSGEEGGSDEEHSGEKGSGGSDSQAKGSGSDRSLTGPKESEEDDEDGKSGSAEEDDE